MLTVRELKTLAKSRGVKGYSKLRKAELEKLLKLKPTPPIRVGSLLPKARKPIPVPKVCTKIILTLSYLFQQKGEKRLNDRDNKLREHIIENIINDKLYYKTFPNEQTLYNNLSVQLKKSLSSLCDMKHDTMKLEVMAGRQHNFDFNLRFHKRDKIIKTIKLEFKYGASTSLKCPQFYSKDVKGLPLFNNTNYIRYFYNHLDEFINSFPITVSTTLKSNRPKTFDEYRKIVNDTSYKHPFQQTIYRFNKTYTDNNMKHKRFVDKHIGEYLNNQKIENVLFDSIRKLLQKQDDKVYLLYRNGMFYTENIGSVSIQNTKMSVKNNNTLIFASNNEYDLSFLLRWKNHKGVALPAWQIKLLKK